MTDAKGDRVTERRPVETFSAVELHGTGKLLLRRGTEHSVVLVGPSEVLRRVGTHVRDGTLIIRHRPSWSIWPRTLRGAEATVTAPMLRSVGVHGAGSVVSEPIVTNDLDIRLSGATKATIERVEAKRFVLSMSGAGAVDIAEAAAEDAALKLTGSGRVRVGKLVAGAARLHLSGAAVVEAGGETRTLAVTVSGTGKIRATTLKAGSATVKLSGAGKIGLWATEALNVRVSGAGKVVYGGTPRVDQRVSGSGSVEPLSAGPMGDEA